jgi:hypothetical protein
MGPADVQRITNEYKITGNGHEVTGRTGGRHMDVFSKGKIGSMELANRIVMPPMCMYIAGDDG